MGNRTRLLWFALLLTLLVSAAIPLSRLNAQDSTVYISIAVQSFSADVFTPKLMQDFESTHPGIKLNIVKYDVNVPTVASGGVDAHLTALQDYVKSADVVYVDSTRIPVTPAATRAGYFLNLAPLVNADTTINVNDFYPPIWQSFQWDNGVWALPNAANSLVLTYDPAAFDKAGIAYPSDKWTIADITAAVNKLGVKDSTGIVTTPGIVITNGSDLVLFRSLLSQGLYDPATTPNQPKIDTPEVETLVDAWTQLVNTGLVSTNNQDFETAPISIGSAQNLLRVNANQVRKAVLLPGNKGGLQVFGYAVTGGTPHPEQAYAVASFLTTRADIAARNAITTARQSLAGARTNPAGGPGGGPGGGPRRTLSPEIQDVVDKALASAISISDMRYTDYLALALKNLKAKPGDIKTALQTVEAQATKDVQTADNYKANPPVALNVTTFVPPPPLAAGKVEIKFNVSSFVSPLPHQDIWNKIIADFVANDPQVGRVTLDTSPRLGGQIDQATTNYDCFYLPNNVVPSANLGSLLNFDPFLSSDKTFDKSDVVGNVLDQLSRDNKIWGYPVIIQPGILQYDAAQFSSAGLPDPNAKGTWTIDAFNNAIKALHPDSSSNPPFAAANTGGTHLLILAAAFGGIPLDYRTNPPTVNYTDPNNVNAIRQVLDLAKNGYIKYDAVGGFNFGGGRNSLDTIIHSATLNSFLQQSVAAGNKNSTYKPIPYPQGTQYSGISYSIGTSYISAKSQNPDACYRFITTITKHPELFSAMPARRSLINDPGIAGTNGPELTALYNQIDTLLKNPNTLSFPSLQGAGGNISGFLLQHWLFGAFDKYVLNSGDLDAALKDAETTSKGFLDCAATIPPFDPATQTTQTYNQQFGACAAKVDPALKVLIGG